jgi:hypothetical protein
VRRLSWSFPLHRRALLRRGRRGANRPLSGDPDHFACEEGANSASDDQTCCLERCGCLCGPCVVSHSTDEKATVRGIEHVYDEHSVGPFVKPHDGFGMVFPRQVLCMRQGTPELMLDCVRVDADELDLQVTELPVQSPGQLAILGRCNANDAHEWLRSERLVRQ